MTSLSPEAACAASRPAATIAAAPVSTTRDLRLDVARGIAMFIILIAHIPNNPWTSWIPARFGFSDATEIFVFCSGMASAIAFGGSFERKGWAIGTARVAFRCWQVYWAHVCLFFFVAMTMAAIDTYAGVDKSYVNALNLGRFFSDPMPQIVGLFTLTYVPNYFDILPMYLVILALMPLVMALARVSPGAAMAGCAILWAVANLGLLPLSAEPWSDRQWFFNPFGWQLLFFTGFAFMRGWLPPPPRQAWIAWAAAAFLVLGAPFGSWKVFTWINDAWPQLGAAIRPSWPVTSELRFKTEFGLLRYIHFLSIAYLAWYWAGVGGTRLSALYDRRIGHILLTIITRVGQQSLAVFVFSMALARLIGFAFDQLGRSGFVVTAGNLMGAALLVLTAYTASWFKSQPWRSKRT
ncbi:OpgC family protein [Marinibacterium sp. SX1]|uniref:OpgC family protein n=1 Tax=Marinibacterium sp. SX1 TaxID=3388424 RepID=UPI003D17439A